MTISYLATKPEWNVQDARMSLSVELERACYSIWIANIWITDNGIFELLIEKAKSGISVEILIDNGLWLDCDDLAILQRFIDAGGELFILEEKYQIFKPENAFCIIDNCVAIDHQIENKPHKQNGYSNYFMREYPETLVEHYINEYLSVKKNCCANRYA
jgi:hypothetical protein